MRKQRAVVPRPLLLGVLLLTGTTAVTALAACGQGSSGEARPTSQAEYREQSDAWSEDYVQCLRDKGVDARTVRQEDGSLSIDPAYGPGLEFEELWNGLLDPDCIESVGEPPELPEATEGFKVAAYGLILEQAECLRENGYVVGEAPPLEQWIEEWDGTRWDPVGEAGENGHDIIELTAACPDPTGLEIEERMLENQERDGSDE